MKCCNPQQLLAICFDMTVCLRFMWRTLLPNAKCGEVLWLIPMIPTVVFGNLTKIHVYSACVLLMAICPGLVLQAYLRNNRENHSQISYCRWPGFIC